MCKENLRYDIRVFHRYIELNNGLGVGERLLNPLRVAVGLLASMELNG